MLWNFGFFAGWSGATFYVDMLVTMYNNFFTIIPTVLYAIMEQDVREEKAALFPESYGVSQRNLLFNAREIARHVTAGHVHALFFFWTSVLSLPFDASDPSGLWSAGCASFGVVVLHVHVRIFLITRHWTLRTAIHYAASLCVFFALSVLYDFYPYPDPHLTGDQFVSEPTAQRVMSRLFLNGRWWLLAIFSFGALGAAQIAWVAANEVFGLLRPPEDGGGAARWLPRGLYSEPTPVDVLRQLSLDECRELARAVEKGEATAALPTRRVDVATRRVDVEACDVGELAERASSGEV